MVVLACSDIGHLEPADLGQIAVRLPIDSGPVGTEEDVVRWVQEIEDWEGPTEAAAAIVAEIPDLQEVGHTQEGIAVPLDVQEAAAVLVVWEAPGVDSEDNLGLEEDSPVVVEDSQNNPVGNPGLGPDQGILVAEDNRLC